MEAGSYMVTARSGGDNMSVDIAANGGSAYVQGDSITAQGLYHIPPHSAVINEAITAADATFPRVDQVVLEIRDHTHDASGGNEARVRVVTGTATSGATLDNRTGAGPLPSNAIRLADVLVPAGDTAISNSQIRDRRLWARGAFVVKSVQTATNYSTSSATLAAIDATNLSARIECSGVPLRMTLHARAQATSAANVLLAPWQDGSTPNSISVLASSWAGGGSSDISPLAQYVFTPAAGSHVLQWAFASGVAATSVSLVKSASIPVIVTIEEVARQNTANNTVSSG